MLEPNGTITSMLDGHCMDVDAGPLRAQAHFCVANPAGGSHPPASERWQLDGPPSGTTIRWGPESDRCLQPASVGTATDEAAPAGMQLVFETVGFSSVDRVRVRDLIGHKDLGVHTGQMAVAPLPAHGVALYNLSIVWPQQPSGEKGDL
eukprot:SAG22_NODE_1067_length_5742_cov_15.152224_3_plen_149_part_00